MIQGGDPLGQGTGGPGYKFEDEFHPEAAPHARPASCRWRTPGRTPTAASSSSRWRRRPWLDNKHSVFGEVVSGHGRREEDRRARRRASRATGRSSRSRFSRSRSRGSESTETINAEIAEDAQSPRRIRRPAESLCDLCVDRHASVSSVPLWWRVRMTACFRRPSPQP